VATDEDRLADELASLRLDRARGARDRFGMGRPGQAQLHASRW
jgi:hypothetical protein